MGVSLSDLSNLEALSADGSPLRESLPDDPGSLAHLKKLPLTSGHLIGNQSPGPGGLTDVEHLGLHGNQLSVSSPPSWRIWPISESSTCLKTN